MFCERQPDTALRFLPGNFLGNYDVAILEGVISVFITVVDFLTWHSSILEYNDNTNVI